MTTDVIPEEIKQFLLKYIDSIAQWEGLLLIKSNHEADWTATDIAKYLYLTDTEAARLLTQLTMQGFLTASGKKNNLAYHYKPKTAELGEMTERTAELYKNYLIPITHFIHSKPKLRIQEFADAFRIRKE